MTLVLATVLTAAVPAAADETCPSAALRATTQPTTRPGHARHFAARYTALERSLASGRYDVLMLGDSHVQLWPQAEAERAFGSTRILNAGISGDRTGSLIHRLESRRTTINADGRRLETGVSGWENQRPRLVFLLVGGNDALRGEPACAVVAGVEAVIQRIRALYPDARLLVSGLLPRGPRLDAFPAAADVNRLLRVVIDRQAPRVRFVDLGASLGCPAEAPCDLLRPPNHGHMTAEGYRRVSETLRAAVSDVVP
ncbi:GDSL-type esterase/lipase family protein [Roseomonas sp. CCTCC AB2023176]|uniref:GDSL-type esterase/lipase family protein n=1 Tax=Roseomonas sp. CCTCC AB2023176 TaxID=3342640 RepID=UPI0035DBC05E